MPKRNENPFEVNLNNIQYITKDKVNGFTEFIKTQGVVGLAIGFMLGDKIKNLVNSLVVDVLNPLLVAVSGSTGNIMDARVNLFGADIFWGKFASNFLDFLIMAGFIYLIYRGLKLYKLEKNSN